MEAAGTGPLGPPGKAFAFGAVRLLDWYELGAAREIGAPRLHELGIVDELPELGRGLDQRSVGFRGHRRRASTAPSGLLPWASACSETPWLAGRDPERRLDTIGALPVGVDCPHDHQIPRGLEGATVEPAREGHPVKAPIELTGESMAVPRRWAAIRLRGIAADPEVDGGGLGETEPDRRSGHPAGRLLRARGEPLRDQPEFVEFGSHGRRVVRLGRRVRRRRLRGHRGTGGRGVGGPGGRSPRCCATAWRVLAYWA